MSKLLHLCIYILHSQGAHAPRDGLPDPMSRVEGELTSRHGDSWGVRSEQDSTLECERKKLRRRGVRWEENGRGKNGRRVEVEVRVERCEEERCLGRGMSSVR